jgi:hypothetical protein
MSDLLNSASLVLIPSGYKEDVVYSAVPTDGSGDLSFTRASNGTRVNSAGLVEVCPWNLAFDSENFGSGYWTRLSSATITTNNTTAPNGTNTGALFSVTSTAYSGLLEGIPDNTQTISMYAKKGTLDYLWFIHENISQLGASFNLNTGVVSFVASGHDASIESVGNGWYRCILSTTNSATWDFFQFGLSNASNSATSPSGGNAYIWGAQANIGSTAKPYFPTTDRLNVPRLTYQNGGGGCPSLLLEKQSTNLVTYSEEFDHAAWLKYQCSVSANQTTSPDGTQNADKLTLSGSSGTYTGLLYRLIAVGANSIYMKNDSIGSGKFYIQVDGVGNAKWNADGTLNSVSGGTATNGENMGNGWFRFTFVVTSGSYINYGIADATTGNSIFIWGAQVEASSYPTSYIPTTSASATRVADVAQKTGISSLIGQTEGVMFVDFDFANKADTSGSVPILLRGGGSEAYIYLSGSNFQADLINGGIQCNIVGAIGAVGRKKIAFAYKQNDFVLYMNGVQIGTDTSGTVGTMNALTVGSYDSPGYVLNSGINQAVLFKTRLTNAELASLTTL